MLPWQPDKHACNQVHICTGGVVSDGLVVCSGYQTTHILPVLDGKLVASHVKR